MAVEVISQGFLNNGWWYYSRMQAPSGHVFGITLDVRGGIILKEGLEDAGLSAVDAADALLKAWEGLQKDQGTTKPADPNGGPLCSHQGYATRRVCSGCGGRLPADWPGAPRLKPDEVDVLLEGLAMLHGFRLADASTTDDVLDEMLNTESGEAGVVSLMDYHDTSAAFESSKAALVSIEDLEQKLRPYATQKG